VAGHPATAHWGLPDPAATSEAEIDARISDVAQTLGVRIGLLVSLPFDKLGRLSLQARVQEAGHQESRTFKARMPATMSRAANTTTTRPRATAKRGASHAQALSRGLAVLEFLASTPGGATLTALAAALHLPAPTAHRLLATLEDADYVQAGEDGRYRVGVRAFRVGTAFLEHRNLIAEAIPRLERLMETSGETANLAVIEHGAAVFVAQAPCRELMRMNARLGARAPLHASGVGKAMLAAMPPREADELIGRGALAIYTDHTLSREPRWPRRSPRRPSAATRSTTRSTRWACAASPRRSSTKRAAVGGAVDRRPDVASHARALPELGERVRAAARDVTAALGGVPPASRKEPR
jgi:IclR family acetate operon transcriptional repressor